MDIVWLQVPQWKNRDGLLHGFLGRRGGKSTGPFASLNLSFRVGDDPQVVKDNICDVKRAVGVHDLRIVTMKQVHGDHILEVNPFDTPPTLRQTQGGEQGRTTGQGLLILRRAQDDPEFIEWVRVDGERHTNNLTPCTARLSSPKSARGMSRTVKDRHIKEAGEADGMVTEERGIFPAVLTADCVPILFSVSGRKLAAVVHAGWRGTLAGIAPKMINRLKERYDVMPASIEAALGPAIGPCCYEIGPDVSLPLIQRWGRLAERCLRGNADRQFLDLKALNCLLLEEAGVPHSQIFSPGPCTSCAVEDFFSYRREKKETGRQISFIGWL